jgi:putative transposase
MKEAEPFKEIGSNSGQQTLKILEQNWKSYFAAIRDYKVNPHKYFNKPKLPNYLDKEHGRFVWVLTNVQSKIINGELAFSFKPVKPFNGLIKTKVEGKHMQTRIVPKNGSYILEIVYQIEIPDAIVESNRILGIDLGLNNLITTQNNFGEKPFAINGKPIKSMNNFYNKKVSKIQSKLKKTNDRHWSNRLDKMLVKRNNKIDNYMHNATRWITDYCMTMKIDTVVIGKNKEWKQGLKMKNFVAIPFEKLIEQLEYKLTENSIKVILTEESYTSISSFIDKDQLSKSKFSGKRIKRGLYKSSNGTFINADVNGAGNIIRKVFPKSFEDGIEGVGLHPVIINI